MIRILNYSWHQKLGYICILDPSVFQHNKRWCCITDGSINLHRHVYVLLKTLWIWSLERTTNNNSKWHITKCSYNTPDVKMDCWKPCNAKISQIQQFIMVSQRMSMKNSTLIIYFNFKIVCWLAQFPLLCLFNTN